MKPLRIHGLSQTPRLREIESDLNGKSEYSNKSEGCCQEGGSDNVGAGNVVDNERRLNEATKSLSDLQRRLAELSREEARAKFDFEDAQLRHSTSQKQVGNALEIELYGNARNIQEVPRAQ